jgi:hypothetical protein
MVAGTLDGGCHRVGVVSITVAVLSIMVAEPYGRDWEQIYMRHLAPVKWNTTSQLFQQDPSQLT